MAWPRSLLLAAAVVLVGVDVASLGFHDFNADTKTASGSAAVTSAPTTTTTLPGQDFEGPRHNYMLRVNSAWPHHADMPIQGIETWQVVDAANGFAPNMNVVVENLPSELSVDTYLHANTASVKNATAVLAGATIIGEQVVNGAYGQQLGRMEYTASVQGHALHFIAIVAVHKKTGVVATFTSPDDRFAQIRALVEPYLLTLRAI